MTFLYVALGTLAGVLAGLFGIGGGVIMVIGMVGLMKLPFPMAVGTSLGAMLLPVGALGALEYYRRGNMDLRAVGRLAIRMSTSLAPVAGSARGSPSRRLQPFCSAASRCFCCSWRCGCG